MPIFDINMRVPAHGPGSQNVIIINCFGRGGSSLIWNMIGSSPDVIMTTEEWHTGIFGNHKKLRRIVTTAFFRLGLRRLSLAGSTFRRRALATRSAEQMVSKPTANFTVLKVMDYHIVYSEAIRAEFPTPFELILTRHPHLQCESLMRSGLSLAQACVWYNDVTKLMLERSGKPGVRIYKFEDLIADPMNFCDRLYLDIGIRWSASGSFLLKKKPFGLQRTANVGVRGGEIVEVDESNVRRFINAEAVAASQSRLSPANRHEIWRATAEVASKMEYGEVSAFGSAD